MALKVKSVADLEKAQAKLQAEGYEVVGPLDHDGFVQSIYFFDPNGARMELTTETATTEQLAQYRQNARGLCNAWTLEKRNKKAMQVATA